MKFEFATKYTSCYNNQLTISGKLYKYNMYDVTLFTVLIVVLVISLLVTYHNNYNDDFSISGKWYISWVILTFINNYDNHVI